MSQLRQVSCFITSSAEKMHEKNAIFSIKREKVLPL